MPYREVIICSEHRTKHMNTPCVQNVRFLYVRPSGT
jgi:hypothetical protein